MGQLFDQIRALVLSERYIVEGHAADQLTDRAIAEWQVVSGIASGTLIAERPRTRPNPSVEVNQMLADGTEVKAVWSLLKKSGTAKLVTVHFYDR